MVRIIIVVLLFVLICPFSGIAAEAGSGDSDGRDEPETHFIKGRSYLLQGNEIEASAAFEKASAIDKAAYASKVIDEYYNAGMMLIKDPKKGHIGLHYLNKYLAAHPDEGRELAPVLYDEGLHMTANNRYLAHGMLDTAMKLYPPYEKDEEFYFAYSVRSANKAADMIKGGVEFMKRFPESGHVPEVMYRIGDAHFELRKIPEARDYFKKVKDRFPDSDWGKLAAKRL